MPPRLFASISTAHFFSPSVSLSVSPSAVRTRIEINDTLRVSAKRDHENRFERFRRKLLDGRLNRPVGSRRRTCKQQSRACAKQVRAENERLSRVMIDCENCYQISTSLTTINASDRGADRLLVVRSIGFSFDEYEEYDREL